MWVAARVVTFAGAASVIAAAPANGQSAYRWSAQASALATTVASDIFESYGGTGVELQIRVSPSWWSHGLGYQYSRHTGETFSFVTPDELDITLSGVFYEPRYVVPRAGTKRVGVYFAGRAAILSRDEMLTSGTDPDDVEEYSDTGFGLGTGAGAVVRLTSRLNLDGGVAILYQRFDDGSISFVAKIGLTVGLGGRR